MKKDVNGVTTHELSQHVKRTNRLYDQVRAPQEAALDSKALALVAEMGAIKSRQMKIEADAFDVDDYIDRLKALLGHSRPAAFVDSDDDEQPMDSIATFDWKKVANLAIRYSRRTPALLFMSASHPSLNRQGQTLNGLTGMARLRLRRRNGRSSGTRGW